MAKHTNILQMLGTKPPAPTLQGTHPGITPVRPATCKSWLDTWRLSSTTLQCSQAMLYAVEGENIDPAMLQEPDWCDIWHSGTANTSQAQPSAATTIHQSKPQRRQNRKKSKPAPPPKDPLPDDDIKVILQQQGGLSLSNQNTALLTEAARRRNKADFFSTSISFTPYHYSHHNSAI